LIKIDLSPLHALFLRHQHEYRICIDLAIRKRVYNHNINRCLIEAAHTKMVDKKFVIVITIAILQQLPLEQLFYHYLGLRLQERSMPIGSCFTAPLLTNLIERAVYRGNNV
jgi:hypothetical protein